MKLQLPDGCQSYAYADDGLILIIANSRSELEKKANRALNKIEERSTENRLKISTEKNKCMLLKGCMARKPIVKLGKNNIEHVTEHMYLGILMGEKLSFKQHLIEAANEAIAI